MTKLSELTMPSEYHELAEQLAPLNAINGHHLAEQMQDIWADKCGLTKAKTRWPWWGRLHGHSNPELYVVKRKKYPEKLPGDRHTSLWNRNGMPSVWCSITYHFDQSELDEAAMKYGLNVSVVEYPGWIDPSLTTMIIWEPA